MVSVANLKKINAASGLFFGVFLSMHLFCHYSTVFGVETANENLLVFRKIYQNPLFEVGLVVALLAHMGTNVALIGKRSRVEASSKKEMGGKEPAGTLELKGHRYTGYFLAFSIFGHVFATRLAPLLLLGKDASKYDYTFITRATSMFGPLFGLYLVLLGMAGGWHLIYGTRSAITTLMGSSVVGKPFPMLLKPVALVSHLLIIYAVVAISGSFESIDTETKRELHDKLYGFFINKAAS